MICPSGLNSAPWHWGLKVIKEKGVMEKNKKKKCKSGRRKVTVKGLAGGGELPVGLAADIDSLEGKSKMWREKP